MNTAVRVRTLREAFEGFVTSPYFYIFTPIVFILLSIGRCSWGGGDIVGWAAIFFSIVFTAVLWKDGWDTTGIAVCVALVALSFLLPLLYVASSPLGVWVNEKTKMTTLSSRLLAVSPFQSSSYFVETKQPQTTKVKSTTSDGIPLTCTAFASGIVLDPENPRLLRTLTLADSMDPKDIIADGLGTEIRSVTSLIIASKTSSEITQLRQFYIPYHVGSKLGNTLSSLGLKWDGGRVSLSCEVVFTS